MAQVKSLSKYLIFLVVVACSSSPEIVYRDVPVYIHTFEYADTLVLRDTVIAKDSVWYGDVVDSLNNKIGDLTVYYKNKIARISHYTKTDTFYIKDTVLVSNSTNSILPVIVDTFNFWENGLFFGGIALILGLIAYLRLKRGKVIWAVI